MSDVGYAIIGANFLRNFNLLVDMANKRLIDATTHMHVLGVLSRAPVLSPTLVKPPPGEFAHLLDKYPDLTKPRNIDKVPKHDVTHHVFMTGSSRFLGTIWRAGDQGLEDGRTSPS